MDAHTRTTKTSFWQNFFSAKLTARDCLPWDDEYLLTAAERRLVMESLQQFQLGESSEGHGFLAAARRYANLTGDRCFPDALALFIKEEQLHSDYLARFMERQGIPLRGSDSVDGIFRWLRKLAGLELRVRVLVTAEFIAVDFYNCLGLATGSPLLKEICKKIRKDESAHLLFQAETVAKLQEKQSPARMVTSDALHQFLLAATCVVFWLQHRDILKVGGLSLCSFLRSQHLIFQRFCATKDRLRIVSRSTKGVDSRPIAICADIS